jgi:23S rRNA (uracil1939-C5)-methyltransferase
VSRRLKDQPPELAAIRDVTLDGYGVADTEGKSVFVDGAITGETVRFRRQRKQKKYDEAMLLELVSKSPDRVDPPCSNFGVCGGCTLQHMSAPAQLDLKQQSLLQSLQRIGNVMPETVLEPLAGRPLGYRRRARLGARYVDKKNRVLVGFRERRSSRVADMQSCETLKPELAALIPGLSDLVSSLSIARHVPQIELSMGDDAIALVFRILSPLSKRDRELLRAFGNEHRVQVLLQPGGPGTVAPLEADTPAADLHYELPDFGLSLVFGPLDFIQVNQDMNRRMVAKALELARPQPTDRVLDLFCGIGNFTLPLATRAGQVIGIELDAAMVAKARANAERNGIQNAAFHAADLAADDIDYPWWGGGFDLVIIDPPRAGAEAVLPQIARTGANRIVYVSCHPGSLARDAGILVSQHGYHLRAAGAMDMFPQTGHVEAIALFERQS